MTAALLSAVPALADTTSTSASTTKMGVEQPSAAPTIDVPTVQGCFSSQGDLKSVGVLSFNSIDKCAVDTCKAQGYAVGASMGANECYCGNEYPPASALVNDSNCDAPCTGYGTQACQCTTDTIPPVTGVELE